MECFDRELVNRKAFELSRWRGGRYRVVRSYIHAVEDLAKYFRRLPDRLGPNHIREYQVQLFRDCKLSAGSISSVMIADESVEPAPKCLTELI